MPLRPLLFWLVFSSWYNTYFYLCIYNWWCFANLKIPLLLFVHPNPTLKAQVIIQSTSFVKTLPVIVIKINHSMGSDCAALISNHFVFLSGAAIFGGVCKWEFWGGEKVEAFSCLSTGFSVPQGSIHYMDFIILSFSSVHSTVKCMVVGQQNFNLMTKKSSKW